MEVTWRIELFGGLRAWREAETFVHFETRKTAALLGYLAFVPGRAYSRDVLAEHLWPNESSDSIRDRFRHALSALRRVLEPQGVPPGSILIADRAQVALNAETIDTDVAAFESALHQAQGAP